MAVHPSYTFYYAAGVAMGVSIGIYIGRWLSIDLLPVAMGCWGIAFAFLGAFFTLRPKS